MVTDNDEQVNSGLYVVRFDAELCVTGSIYALYVNSANTYPYDHILMDTDNRFLFTAKRELLPFLHRVSLLHSLPLGTIPIDEDCVYSMPQCIEFIAGRKKTDRKKELLNLILVLLDSIEALERGRVIRKDCHLKHVLITLQLHLTLEKRLSEFFRMTPFTRGDMSEAIYWAIGNIISHSYIVTSLDIVSSGSCQAF